MDLSDKRTRRRINGALRERGVPAKACGKCFVVKGHEAFSPNAQGMGSRASTCKSCHAETRRAQYMADPAHEIAASRRWRAANPAKVAEQNRKWYTENTDRKREYDQQWRAAYPGKAAELRRQWYRANPEANRANVRRWRAENPLKARTTDQRKRAVKKSATVEPFTARDLRHDWEEHDLWDCFFCGGSLVDGYEVEHFYALSNDGPHALFNLVPACMPCNRGAGGKGTKEPWGYLRDALAEQGTDLDACLAILDGVTKTTAQAQN
ncbi:HNH endonuclease [Streptomyces sp. NPDC060001]|uniref:HNH endonuclease signature motif containing protein n=1 Tax=Streptomyces sp. NPDC060001 TaxID=3347032 RepID=UPI0036B86071